MSPSRIIGLVVTSMTVSYTHLDRVAINYNTNKDRAQALAAALEKEGYPVKTFRADVSNMQEVIRMINDLHHAFGPVDVLVNNAGIAEQKVFADITEQDWDRMFATNVKGMYQMCIRDRAVSAKRGRRRG